MILQTHSMICVKERHDPGSSQETMLEPTPFGVMMVKKDLADGLVAGAVGSTADTLRPALQILRTKEGTNLVSSFS